MKCSFHSNLLIPFQKWKRLSLFIALQELKEQPNEFRRILNLNSVRTLNRRTQICVFPLPPRNELHIKQRMLHTTLWHQTHQICKFIWLCPRNSLDTHTHTHFNRIQDKQIVIICHRFFARTCWLDAPFFVRTFGNNEWWSPSNWNVCFFYMNFAFFT